MMQPQGVVSIYSEAASVIVVLVRLGQVLELRARSRTGGAIKNLAESRATGRAARASVRMVMKKSRSKTFTPAIYFESAPATKSRWTASLPKGIPASENGCNALGIPIAAGLLYPFFGVLLSPMIADVAISFSSVSVITNTLRLRRAKLRFAFGRVLPHSVSTPPGAELH